MEFPCLWENGRVLLLLLCAETLQELVEQGVWLLMVNRALVSGVDVGLALHRTQPHFERSGGARNGLFLLSQEGRPTVEDRRFSVLTLFHTTAQPDTSTSLALKMSCVSDCMQHPQRGIAMLM